MSDQLALETIRREEMGIAVMPERAVALLRLWQALRGGVMARAEVVTGLEQIEGHS